MCTCTHPLLAQYYICHVCMDTQGLHKEVVSIFTLLIRKLIAVVVIFLSSKKLMSQFSGIDTGNRDFEGRAKWVSIT